MAVIGQDLSVDSAQNVILYKQISMYLVNWSFVTVY